MRISADVVVTEGMAYLWHCKPSKTWDKNLLLSITPTLRPRDFAIDGSKGRYSQSHITSELARFKRGEATYSYA